MNRVRLFVPVLVSSALVLAAFAGCGGKKEQEVTEEPQAAVESEREAAPEEVPRVLSRVPEGGGLVVVKSIPPGADILLGGQPTGVKTPYNVAAEAGNYEVSVVLAGFTATPEMIPVEVTEGTMDTITFTLEGQPLASYMLIGLADKEVWPAWSPDGKKIAYEAYYGNNRDIFVISIEGGQPTRITSHRKADASPCWTPDGKEIVFTSNRDGTVDLWIVSASGGEPRKLAEGPGMEQNVTFSPDGKWIAFESMAKIWKMPAGGGEMTQVTFGEQRHFYPDWSPDGKEIAFTVQFPDSRQIWAVDVKSGDVREIVKDKGWSYGPQWSPSGKVIAFARRSAGMGEEPNHDLWVVDAGGGQLTQITLEKAIDQYPSWAPTGDQLVWTKQADLWVMTNLPDWLLGEGQ
jgi:TolB protein